jgi:GT2 family glycosyltransferase
MPRIRPGLVSVVLVNFRGAADTIEAIHQIRLQDWPADHLEIVVVDNASGDESAAKVRASAPDVRLIESHANLGFAGGSNLGVAKSSGEFVAFLNNDAKPAPGWIRNAIDRFGESAEIAAVASKVLDWDGKRVDYVGAAMTWYGMGYKPFTSDPVSVVGSDNSRDVLFGTGAAMFVRRSAYEALGGFDERYFMFFEDVDFGWRLNLRGWRFVYEPKSIAFHKHHASMKSFGSFKETYLLERNALYTLYKNLGDDALNDSLAAAMALSVRRGITRGKLNSGSFDLRVTGGDAESDAKLSKQTVAALYAIDQFVEELPDLVKARAEIQAQRSVSEGRIRRLFGKMDAPILHDKPYLQGYENLMSAFDIGRPTASPKVLIITGDPIGAKLAGPAIRAWNMARVLSRDHEVTLVSLSRVEPLEAPFDVVHVAPGQNREFNKLEAWSDIIIFQGHAMAVFGTLRKTTKVVVVDIYDPIHLEQLEQGRELPAAQWGKQVESATGILNQQLERGDFFLCASERQRMFWLGQLAGLGRINPRTYDNDPDLKHLISVVPFGLSSKPPEHSRNVLKGVVPGIGLEDKVLLWSGGLYNWFDPKSLIVAVADLAQRRDGVRLYFQGTKHPHPDVPEMAIVGESQGLAKELGVLDKLVFFNPSWVDYSDRQNYLIEADAGVSTHFAHIETTFSFRTRILDYLWAELPMVVTAGDHFADLVQSEGLGLVVEADNVQQLSSALERILFDESFIRECRRNIQRIRTTYYWENVFEPLVAFVANAHRAADFADGEGAAGVRRAASRPRRPQFGFRHDVSLAWYYLRKNGPTVVLRKMVGRLARR